MGADTIAKAFAPFFTTKPRSGRAPGSASRERAAFAAKIESRLAAIESAVQRLIDAALARGPAAAA